MLETAWGNWWLLELADALDKYKVTIGELPTGTANVLSK
jgi:diacylglycerol kinase family enzyme